MKQLTLLLAGMALFSLSLVAQYQVQENQEATEEQPTFVIEAEDTYLVLDGPQSSADVRMLEPDWIESIQVYKEENKCPQAYRDLVTHGLIVIKLKEEYRNDLPQALFDQATMVQPMTSDEVIEGKKAPDNLRLGIPSENPPTFVIELDESYVVLEDPESNDIRVLEPDWIESLQVFKNQDQYPEPYQELGEHGLIVIQLKEQYVKDLPQSIRDRVIKQN